MVDDHARDPQLSLTRGNAELLFFANRLRDGSAEVGITVLNAGYGRKRGRDRPAVSFAFKRTDSALAVAVQYPGSIIDGMTLDRGTSGKSPVGSEHRLPASFESIQLAENDYVVIRVRAPASDRYYVKWPDVLIDGNEVELPPVTFIWKHGLRFQLVND